MKIFKYGLPFAALALLASCSNDNLDAPQAGGAQNEVDGNATYVSFNLALPNSVGTKADSFGGYDSGDPQEYAINNVVLYLYKKTDSDVDYVFHQRYPLGLQDLNVTATNSGITETQKVTFQITDIDAAEKATTDFYAFVVVNEPNENFGPKETYGTWESKPLTTSTRAYKSAVYGEQNTEANPMIPVIGGKSYFTMTNAPLWDGTKVQKLVKLNKEAFATSPAAATTSAATIYVQRGVAKVKANGANGVSVASVKVGDKTKDVVAFDGWALDVTNLSGFPVQNVEADSYFTDPGNWSAGHFFGSIPGSTNLQQIWWAKDTNYGEPAAGSFNNITSEGTSIHWNEYGDDDWEYCFENTMDYENQVKDATTRVVFKGKYKLDGKEGSFVVFDGTDLAAPVTDNDIADLANENIVPVNGKYQLNKLIPNADKRKEVRQALGCADDAMVAYYPGGVTYYTALIRHFNDDEAGLNGLVVNDAKTYTAAQLGRYGVLRNNTYQVNIAKVIGFGSPEIPTPTPDPDDKPDPVKYNIVLDIQVLDWAKRSNDYEIK